MYLLARRNEAMNQWLEQNPVVLGCIFLVLGSVVAGFGVAALVTGRAKTKWGNELQGPLAYLQGGVMTLVGSGIGIFGLVKLVSAFL